MKIKRVLGNNRKRSFLLETETPKYEFPYDQLTLKPSKKDPLEFVEVDDEAGGEAFVYRLASGRSDTVLLEQVRYFNRDPEVLRVHMLYEMTIQALNALDRSRLSKRALARRLNTSPRQLYRLLDTTFYGKTIDQMIKLLNALGYEVDLKVKKRKAA